MNKLNLSLLIVIIFLIVIGFWGDKVVLFLTSQYLLNFYPQFLATLVGASLGIPFGLFINRLTEEKKDKKILRSVLTFIKTELVANLKYIENLQHSAETIISLPDISEDDLATLGKFTSILSQEYYIAAQSSISFASIENKKLLSSILNSYMNIQRILGGVISFENIEGEERRTILSSYIALCERTKESISLCVVEIDEELKNFGSKLTILE